MTFDRPAWDLWAKAGAIKDQELAEAEEKSSFEPPPGQYECCVVGRSGVIFTNDQGESNFSFNVTFKIMDGDYIGKTFYSQDYNLSEQGIGWTKAFVKTLANMESPPNTVQELANAVDLAIAQQHGITLDVKYRTYTKKKDQSQVTKLQEKILAFIGSYKGTAEEAPAENVLQAT